jgi:type I restriction-modification system DNA methylase subunit
VRLFELLSKRYDVVAANPPYMGSSNLAVSIKNYIQMHYPEGKRDIYTAFILRNINLCRKSGRIAMITQQSWMFLKVTVI